jgi:pyocin large subunit-like protein
MANKYTYLDFANEVKGLVKGEIAITAEIAERVIAKADDLAKTQENKANYNKNNPKKAEPKGASEDTKAKANAIAAVIDNNPKTASEINGELGTDFTALQVANAVKFIPGVVSVKVIRETVNAKGLKAQKEYTAYTRG